MQITRSLENYGEILNHKEIDSIYQSLLPILYEAVQPTGIFSIDMDNTEVFKGKYKYIIPCIITTGAAVDKKIENYFSDCRTWKGLVLDAMCTSYLFEISSQMFDHIYELTSRMGLGLSCRISPGDGNLPLEYQKYILSRLHDSSISDIHITESYALTLIHSMTYIYGASSNIKLNKIDHDCKNCSNGKFCTMRKDLI